MLGDAAGALEVPGVTDDEGCFKALLLHDGFCFCDVLLGGLGRFLDMDLVREDAVF